MKIYLEANIPFGRDSRGKNIILRAFVPLKITAISVGALRVLVKPKGRGNYREYLVKTDLLKFEEETA